MHYKYKRQIGGEWFRKSLNVLWTKKIREKNHCLDWKLKSVETSFPGSSRWEINIQACVLNAASASVTSSAFEKRDRRRHVRHIQWNMKAFNLVQLIVFLYTAAQLYQEGGRETMSEPQLLSNQCHHCLVLIMGSTQSEANKLRN